jgi:hypothetical protein
MQFTRLSARRGILKLGEYAINTPALALPTSLYSLPHLTRDMFDQVLDPSRTILEVYYEDILENFDVLQKLPMSFKKYANLDGYAIWLALRETRYFENAEGLTHVNSDSHISCLHHGGVSKLSIALIKEMQAKIKPEAIVAPADHFVLPGNEKRMKKSIARTAKYSSELQDCPNLIKSIIHSSDLSFADNSIVAISAVDKSFLSSSESMDNFSNSHTNRSAALYWRGSYDLQTALRLLLRGQLDILDGSSILAMSEQGLALQLPTDEIDVDNLTIASINIFDKQFEADTTQLCVGCPCPGCKFMKAYVHHLFVVHELLGPAVLSIHNLFQVLHLLSKI